MSGHIDVPPSLYTITPRTLAELQQLVAEQLQDGTTCFVTDQKALYILSKASTLVVSNTGVMVVATGRGASAPGRWIQVPAVTNNDPTNANVSTKSWHAASQIAAPVALPAATDVPVTTTGTDAAVPVPAGFSIFIQAEASVTILGGAADSEVTLSLEYKGDQDAAWINALGAPQKVSVAANKRVLASIVGGIPTGLSVPNNTVLFRVVVNASTAASAETAHLVGSVSV